jgi:hypothetical protein
VKGNAPVPGMLKVKVKKRVKDDDDD